MNNSQINKKNIYWNQLKWKNNQVQTNFYGLFNAKI